VGRGTPPLSVDLRVQRSISLTLRPMTLDAKATIEPTPGTSAVYVNGEFAGVGTWRGALPSGRHRVDVIAPGYLPLRRELRLEPGSTTSIAARLTASQARTPKLTGFYLEPQGGLVFSRSLRGGVDQACDCSTRSRPFGWTVLARVGYSVLAPLAVELSGGYLTLQERSTRPLTAGSEPGTTPFRAQDFRDSVALAGPFASTSAAARFLRGFPLTTRLTGGVALLNVSLRNGGTFSGQFWDETQGWMPTTGRLVIEEPSRRAVVPFLATEIRFGRTLTSRLSADVGASATVYFPPELPRAQRAGLLGGGDNVGAGVLTLPDEAAIKTFLTVVPSLGLRLEL
jgi:hypothetical protein